MVEAWQCFGLCISNQSFRLSLSHEAGKAPQRESLGFRLVHSRKKEHLHCLRLRAYDTSCMHCAQAVLHQITKLGTEVRKPRREQRQFKKHNLGLPAPGGSTIGGTWAPASAAMVPMHVSKQ